MARIREDLLAQARERAQGEQDQARVMALESTLLVRQGDRQAALHRCQQGVSHRWTRKDALAPPFSLQAARICLNLGHTDAARDHLDHASALKDTPEYALALADLSTMTGDIQSCLSITRAAIAQTLSQDLAGTRAKLSLRLGSALKATGDRPGANKAILSAQETLRIRGHRADMAEANYRAADLALGRGHASTARVWLEPILPITRSFGLGVVQAEVWRIKMAIATALGDDDAARAAIAGWDTSYGGDDAGWRHALVRWHWSQKNVEQAIKAAGSQ